MSVARDGAADESGTRSRNTFERHTKRVDVDFAGGTDTVRFIFYKE